jgi:hypothetical protein
VIISIDPGKHVGLASYDLTNGYRAKVITADEACQFLIYSRLRRSDRVVVENFAGGGRISNTSRDTILLIGRIMGVCEAIGVSCELQPASYKDPFVTQAAEILGRTVTQHVHDDVSALSHLLAFQYNQKQHAEPG